MTNEEKYGGWDNYETWVTHLWLTNEENTYRGVMQWRTPDALRAFVETYIEDSIDRVIFSTGSLLTDLLSHALDRVNWQEIFDGLHEGEEE